MNNDWKYLLDLEEIDIKIIELENSKMEFPISVDKLENAIEESKNKIIAIEEDLAVVKIDKDSITEKINNAKSSLERSQERLNSIKTNKEFDAVHVEIESQKNIVATGDKHIERYNDDISRLQTELNEYQNKLDKDCSEHQPVIDDLKSKIATIDTSIKNVAKKRGAIISNISPQFFRAYEHVRKKRKNGKVLSVIDNANKNCSICYQMLQPHVVSLVRKGLRIVFCQNCGSILLWSQSLGENK